MRAASKIQFQIHKGLSFITPYWRGKLELILRQFWALAGFEWENEAAGRIQRPLFHSLAAGFTDVLL
jgi:hypothetical protein